MVATVDEQGLKLIEILEAKIKELEAENLRLASIDDIDRVNHGAHMMAKEKLEKIIHEKYNLIPTGQAQKAVNDIYENCRHQYLKSENYDIQVCVAKIKQLEAEIKDYEDSRDEKIHDLYNVNQKIKAENQKLREAIKHAMRHIGMPNNTTVLREYLQKILEDK